jgi:hypothetical protein
MTQINESVYFLATAAYKTLLLVFLLLQPALDVMQEDVSNNKISCINLDAP